MAVDTAIGRRWGHTRTLLFVAVYLLFAVAGVIAAAGLWAQWRLLRWRRERFLDHNFALQCWWAAGILGAGCRIFRARVDFEGDEVLEGRPLIVLARHSSLADTLLPAALLSARHGLRLRWVLKRELLWDPCLDIVGNRLRNAFVERGGDDSTAEVRAVAALADRLDDGEGVLIYPEGTRFSTEKRRRILDSLQRHDPALYRAAKRLRHVLPPRLGGPMALLGARGRARIAILEHVGLESATRLADLRRGNMVGRQVRVRLRAIPDDAIPTAPEDARAWLYETWQEVDDWVGAELGRGTIL